MGTYLGHPLFGGAGVKGAASTWHKYFRVHVEEGENLLEGEIFLSIPDGFGVACFEDNH